MEVYKLRLKSLGSVMLKGRARPKDSVNDPPSWTKGETPQTPVHSAVLGFCDLRTAE